MPRMCLIEELMRSREKWPRRAWKRFSNCTSNCPTCPLARSTESFLQISAYTKVSEASVAV
eukprot:6077287-Pleurochrysis_carterae.AAC.1